MRTQIKVRFVILCLIAVLIFPSFLFANNFNQLVEKKTAARKRIRYQNA